MTIVPRGDRFGVKVWDRGKRAYRWVGTFDSETKAQERERDASIRPGRDRLTVAQWSRIWLADYPRPAAATRRTYAYAAGVICRDLGHLRLDALTRPAARQHVNGWPRSTVLVARTMWGDAVREGVCEVNPFANLRLRTPRGRRDLDALTERQIVELADVAEGVHAEYGTEARAIVLVLGFTGLRAGELCALRHADVDMAAGELTVRASRDGTGVEKSPKNGLARVVVLPPAAAEAFRVVPRPIASEYAFHSVRGQPLSKGTLTYVWRPIRLAWRERTGQDVTPHHLRHACATLLLERGLSPADVAVQLGHTDGGRQVQMLYGHPSEDRARDRVRMAFAAEAPNVATSRRVS